MTKLLPVVTERTIKEIGNKAVEDNDSLIKGMAVANPDLYRFVYSIYKMPEADKTTMFGILVGMYHMLEKQIQIDGSLEIEDDKE